MTKVSKSINFYKVRQEDQTLKYNSEVNILYSIFNDIFNNKKVHELEYEDKPSLIFEKININKDYIFAKYCKEEKYNSSTLTHTRDLTTKQTKPITINPNERFEQFTYFYINFNKNILAKISNKNLPKLDKILPDFVLKSSLNEAYIKVDPIIVKDVEEHIKNIESYSHLELFFNGEPDECFSLSDILEDNTVEGYKLQIKISKNKTKSFKLNGWEKFSKGKSNIKKGNIKYINEFNLETTLNLITSMITKTIPIELSDDMNENERMLLDVFETEIGKL